MLERCLLDAGAAVVPVRAIQTLVANAVDRLVAAIAEGVVANVTAWSEGGLGSHGEDGLIGGGLESMSRVVAMLVGGVASNAQIEVITGGAGDKLSLGQDVDAVVASACRHAVLLSQSLGLLGECSGHFPLRFLLILAANTLSRAGDHLAVLNGALDQPVALARAEDAVGNACLAEVVVTAVTDTAMIVCIIHCDVAVVAVDRPLTLNGSRGSNGRLAAAEGKLAVAWVTGTSNGLFLLVTFDGEASWQRRFVVDQSLLGGASLTELEDTAADGTAVKCGGVTRGCLVDRRVDDDRLRNLQGSHAWDILCWCLLLGLGLDEVWADGGLQPEL